MLITALLIIVEEVAFNRPRRDTELFLRECQNQFGATATSAADFLVSSITDWNKEETKEPIITPIPSYNRLTTDFSESKLVQIRPLFSSLSHHTPS